MLKLARWCTRHPVKVVVAWVLLLVLVGGLSRAFGTSYSDNFALPGSGTQRAEDLLRRSFPTAAGDRDQIVFQAARGNVREAAVRDEVGAMLERVAHLPYVAEVLSPYAPAHPGGGISSDGRTAFAGVIFTEGASALPNAAVRRVIAVASAAARGGLRVALAGKAIESVDGSGSRFATAIGLSAAVVVLLLTFGSVIAMGLPILTALFGLGSGVSLIVLFSHVLQMPDFSSELAAMVGLGVGVDYALFIVTRFREGYNDGPAAGDVRAAVIEAMNSAGRAVIFAGVTVVIALLGMLLLGVALLNGAAIASAIGVAMVMLGSVTLLPALMMIAGERLARTGRAVSLARRVRGGPRRSLGAWGWERWSAFVQRRARPLAALATVALVIVAAPVSAMRLGSAEGASQPAGSTTERATHMLAAGFGRGYVGPLLIVAQARAGRMLAVGGRPGPDVERLEGALRASPDVASLGQPRANATGSVVTVAVYPRSSPQDLATTSLVARLRDRVLPAVTASTGMAVYVGGVTAAAVDFATTLSEKLPLFVGVVVLVSALLLFIVFRSLVIPLQGALMNLLSIGASLGVVVAIFQWGWLRGLVGIAPGPIESFLPVMLFAIVFGLSMDYEVFLISRIHEQWRRSGKSASAVTQGVALTGRVITAAAAIMVCVFLSFMLGEERIIEEFGLCLATAIFLDAAVIRCVLLPAVLHLLGERTWRLPAWLARALPRLDIDGGAGPAGVTPQTPQTPQTPLPAPATRPKQAAIGVTGGAAARTVA